MKLKNLMKKIEAANAIAECVGTPRVHAYIEIDGLPLGDYVIDGHHFYDWNHVAATVADEYTEDVQRDVAKENLYHEHRHMWKIYGKSATIVITLFRE